VLGTSPHQQQMVSSVAKLVASSDAFYDAFAKAQYESVPMKSNDQIDLLLKGSRAFFINK